MRGSRKREDMFGEMQEMDVGTVRLSYARLCLLSGERKRSIFFVGIMKHNVNSLWEIYYTR